MRHLAYFATLLACLVGAGWLEVGMRTRVLHRWRRLAATVVPVLAVFTLWDRVAIGLHHWTFDARLTTGATVWRVPVEELAFFVVIPLCAVLTFEAVRALRGWTAGDEAE
jgi:lycopene cyclase domain-containing protein